MTSSQKYRLRLTLLLVLLLLFFIADLLIGSVTIPLSESIRILMGKSSDSTMAYILYDFRMPKAMTAIVVGAGLSVTGLIMQTLFRNPLAGPFVLGISSGASLGVALFTMATSLLTGAAAMFLMKSSWGLVIAAVIGASLIMLLTVLVSLRIKDSVSLLIVGIMFGSITGAIVTVLQYFSDPTVVHNYLIWTFGSLSGITWTQVYVLLAIFIPGMGVAFLLVKNLNAILLGENYAQSVGVNTRKLRIVIIALTSLIAGSITAFVGPIGFVGVAVPHISRFGLNTSDHKKLMPVVALTGAILMLLFDIVSQLPGYQNTLPLNAVTAIFGAPVVIWVIFRSKTKRAGF